MCRPLSLRIMFSWRGADLLRYAPMMDSSSFDLPSSLLPYPSNDPAPMAYSFLPSYMPQQTFQQPPTPTSAAGPATPSGIEFFNDFINDTLERHDRPSTPSDGTPTPNHSTLPLEPRTGDSTPSLSRAMARTALTPESSPGPGPSPSKKQKTNPPQSPTRRSHSTPTSKSTMIKLKLGSQSQPLAGSSSSTLTPLPSPSTPKTKRVVVVEIPSYKKELHSQNEREQEEEESEDDDLGWGDEGRDKDGDWHMDDAGFRGGSSPDPLGNMMTPGSGRTGDRDMRCELYTPS